MRRHRIYIAGAISPRKPGGEGALEFLGNLREGIKLSTEVLRAGFAVFSPFIDFQFFLHTDGIDLETIKASSMEFLRVCEAVIVVRPWGHSEGTGAELEEAEDLGIPIFFTVPDLVNYFKPIRVRFYQRGVY